MTAPTEADPVVAAGTDRPVTGWNQLGTLTRAMMRGFLRDRTALFFTFFFPLMFLLVFGLIFRDSGSTSITVGVVGSGPIVANLPPGAVTVQRYDTLEAALAQVRSGDLPAVVVQDGDRITLRYAASDQVKAAIVQGIVSSVVDRANVTASGRAPTFRLDADRVEDDSLKAIQFITPGIMSWGVATSAAFGAALTLVSWRRKQLLRRVRLSPAPVWTVVGARVGVSLMIALVQAVMFVAVALTPPFGLVLTGSWWLAIPLLMAGTTAFLSIGLLVGAIAKTEEAASAMVNFIVLPMAFLSGTFFDISQAPAWLRAVSRVFPLRWLNDAMLDVLARGQGVSAVGLPIAVLLAFSVLLAWVATRVFRWDDA